MTPTAELLEFEATYIPKWKEFRETGVKDGDIRYADCNVCIVGNAWQNLGIGENENCEYHKEFSSDPVELYNPRYCKECDRIAFDTRLSVVALFESLKVPKIEIDMYWDVIGEFKEHLDEAHLHRGYYCLSNLEREKVDAWLDKGIKPVGMALNPIEVEVR